ncbi:glycogen phosphorylase [Methylomarinovum tepidoasis]|uniref:Glycogen phosphorylase n=1 Tax=Methylomarinovum tepidoasis TaxID=2840183 RepID=A0AAU9BVP2_9GAMM|nr:alpha-glucan family phosphorylase [Methylomarinovum sp. IN45]BCX87650.1 glycogen phosphorylase [Methylomarinovum sp. IN45]
MSDAVYPPACFPHLPEALRELIPLALDLRWSWSHVSDVLWETLDPEAWRLTGNPWLILQSVSPAKLEALAQDPDFCRRLEEIAAERRRYLERPTWFQEAGGQTPLQHIAYFCMEYGLTEALPLYSGGLGILAGDYLKSCSDLGLPVIGIGLLYQEGYFRQILDEEGNQVAVYPNNNPWELPVTPVRTDDGQILRMHYQFNGFNLWVRVWQAQIGRTRLYLLDLNDPANPPSDRCITDRLYGGGTEQRLQQEILLGIVGWQLLERLGLTATLCHLNEGHAAFAVLERARSYMRRHRVDFELALTVTRAGNLFTTHTPVAAGFDRFPPALIRRYFSHYCDTLGIPVAQLLALGRSDPGDDSEPFNMAWLAIRGSGAVNGVSRLHGEVSRRIFSPLFPRWPVVEVPVGHVTNGVHTPSWDSPESDRLWTDTCGEERWICDPCHTSELIRKVDGGRLWECRTRNRRRLVQFIRDLRAQRPASFNYLPADTPLLDPNILTLGFARRFTGYKRPNLLLTDPARLLRLFTHPHHPVQLVLAGKAHPQDWEGQAMLRDWIQFIRSHPEIAGRIVFLPDYDMQLAEQIVEGVDAWINTPRRPWEACGTSGMKVLVNGGLNISELDGWWAEAYDPAVGWAIGDGREHDSDPAWDRFEAEQLYQILETEVAPAFYHRDPHGIPTRWLAKMRESMARLTPHFSANRMVRQYTEQYYLPLAQDYVRRHRDDQAVARDLLAWRHRLESQWHTLHFGELEVSREGDVYRFQVQVYLGTLAPEAVQVEIYADPQAAGEPPWRFPMTPAHPLLGSVGGFLYRGEAPALRPQEHYTVRIVPRHTEAKIPLEVMPILWQR